MIASTVMYCRIAFRYVATFLCACFAITAMMTVVTKAQPKEPQSKQPVDSNRSQIDQGARLIHGNYCGPGSRPGTQPVDALDAACMRHDACMPSNGLPSCGCMTRLKNEAEAVAQDALQPPDIQILASATAAGAALTPCQPSQ